MQYPYSPDPDTHSHPNLKFDPFSKHLNTASIQTAHLPKKYLMMNRHLDSVTGNNSKKKKKYQKKAMDIRQIHCVYENDCIYSFYLYRQPATKKFMIKDIRHSMHK